MLGDGYGKIFKQIYAGTLRSDWKALITFEQMIVLCDPDGTFDMPPEVLHNITGIPLDIILDGIKTLESPDPRSRSPEHDGRRIIRIDDHRDWGWHIVNHRYYRDLATRDDKRAADRIRIAAKRAGEKDNKNNDVAECRGVSQTSRKSPTQTQTHTQTKNTTVATRPSQGQLLEYPEEFQAVWGRYPPRAGSNPKTKAFQAWRARIADGVSPLEMREGVTRYAKFCNATGKNGTEYVMQASTFFGRDKRYAESWDLPKADPKKQQNGYHSETEIMQLGRSLKIEARPGESLESYRARLIRAQAETARAAP